MSIITEETDILKTAIRVIKIEKFQRFCLKCGKILPMKIKQNYENVWTSMIMILYEWSMKKYGIVCKNMEMYEKIWKSIE